MIYIPCTLRIFASILLFESIAVLWMLLYPASRPNHTSYRKVYFYEFVRADICIYQIITRQSSQVGIRYTLSRGVTTGLFYVGHDNVIGIICPLDWDKVYKSENLGLTALWLCP